MRSKLLKASLTALLSVTGWLTINPQPAQGQVIAVAAGVWGWRNIVAPRVGGPFIAPEVRFRPFYGWQTYGPYEEFPTTERQAQIIVAVPDANAQVWIQGTLMQGTGRQRAFASPLLQPGFNYSYEIRARWSEGNQVMDQTRTVPIHAGQQVEVDFSRPAS